jgi:hypothetical protein
MKVLILVDTDGWENAEKHLIVSIKPLKDKRLIFKHKIIHIPTEEEIKADCKEIAKESTAPDKDTPDWMLRDIRNGHLKCLKRMTDEK